MADKDKDGESKNIEFEGEATDKDTGEKHEFSGEMEVAPVTSIEEARKPDTVPTCVKCNNELYQGKCVNANCEVGQAQWSVGAGRTTAKAAAAVSAPNAFTRSGRVD